MKTTDHLTLLQKIITNLNSIKEADDIGKELLDDIIKFCEIDENLVYGDLLNQESLVFYLKEYQILILESKNILVNRKLIFDEFSVNVLFRKLMGPYEFRCELAINDIQPNYMNRLRIWKLLDKYDKGSLEMINLRKEEKIADNDYKVFKQKQKIAENEKGKMFNDYSYLLSFEFTPFIDKLNIIEKWILRLSGSYTFSQDTFKNEKATLLAFSVFVKNNLLKEVPYLDFYSQMTLSKTLTLEKNKSKDKYIAYAINKLKDYIIESKKEIWEKKLVKYFEIKDYEKKKTVNDSDLKTEEHKKIDLEIDQFFENLKS